MKTRRIPLAIAVAAALFTPSTAAFAAALGEVAALSALGERFRAEIDATVPKPKPDDAIAIYQGGPFVNDPIFAED